MKFKNSVLVVALVLSIAAHVFPLSTTAKSSLPLSTSYSSIELSKGIFTKPPLVV